MKAQADRYLQDGQVKSALTLYSKVLNEDDTFVPYPLSAFSLLFTSLFSYLVVLVCIDSFLDPCILDQLSF